MRATTLFTLLLALSGCGSGNQGDRIYPISFGQDVVGTSAYVTVSNVWNDADALPLAMRHCTKFGKTAKFVRMTGYRATFDCVKVDT